MDGRGSAHYSECMQTMEESIANNTDAFSVISHRYDIEGETMLSFNVVTAIVNGVEIICGLVTSGFR